MSVRRSSESYPRVENLTSYFSPQRGFFPDRTDGCLWLLQLGDGNPFQWECYFQFHFFPAPSSLGHADKTSSSSSSRGFVPTPRRSSLSPFRCALEQFNPFSLNRMEIKVGNGVERGALALILQNKNTILMNAFPVVITSGATMKQCCW